MSQLRNQTLVIGLIFSGLLIADGLVSTPAWAQPKATSIFPAGGQRGQTVEATVNGSFPSWPVEFQVLGSGVSFQCEETKGKVKIQIDETAVVGPRWFRAHDATGADAWRCLLVGRLKEVREKEPNEEPTAEPLALPVIVNGKLAKSGDVDVQRFSLEAGQKLVAAIDANRWLGSPLDFVLQICDDRGFVLAQNDDNRGLDPLLVFTAPETAEYQIRVFAFPVTPNSSIQFAGSADGVYRLTLTTGGYVDFVLPLATVKDSNASYQWHGWSLSDDASVQSEQVENVTLLQHATASGFVVAPRRENPLLADSKAESPQPITAPTTISGVLQEPAEQHAFLLEAKKGDRFRLQAEAFNLGFLLDPLLSVEAAEGKVIKEMDDIGRSERDPAFSIVAPADGPLTIRIRDTHRFGGDRYAYRLLVTPETPQVELEVASQSVSLQAGKEVELTVNVNRIGGSKETLKLAVEGLPEGVSAEPVEVDAKAKSAKLKLKAAEDAKPHQGAIRVIGATDAEKVVAGYDVTPLRLTSVWLTVAKEK